MNRLQKTRFLTRLAAAAAGLACCAISARAATNVVAAPGAIQPGGDANDNTVGYGQWWTNPSGTSAEDFDSTQSSSNNIPGSIHVAMQMQGNQGDGSSANLAFGNWWAAAGANNGSWLGNPDVTPFDVSQYASLDFDMLINNSVSSNSDIPITLYGASYANISLGSVPVTAVGWQHYSFPIPASANLPDCVAWGFYNWYNTTATTPPGYDEFWVDNVKLVAKSAVVPPPSLAISAVTKSGLFLDSGPGDSASYGAISTAQDAHWWGNGGSGPVSYSLTVGSVPNPAVYSNYQAYIFITPATAENTYWNPSDEGWLFITNSADGTATARLMWKTNDANDNTMYYNGQPGGVGGTNNRFGLGNLGNVTASNIVGTWSLTFTSDTNVTVTGPGGASGNFVLPSEYLTSFQNVSGQAFAYFGASPNVAGNGGQAATLSNVSVTGGPDPVSENFSSSAYDNTQWTLNGSEVAIIPSGSSPAYTLTWTIPAANFTLWETSDLGQPWEPVSGNTNLAVTVTPYTYGTNHCRALVLPSDLSSTNHAFFELRKLLPTQLQILMPGETNAPNTPTGKTGTPLPEALGNTFPVVINAVDAKYNIVSYVKDSINITSPDVNAILTTPVTMANGSATMQMSFGTAGSQTVTATDTTATALPAATSSAVVVQ